MTTTADTLRKRLADFDPDDPADEVLLAQVLATLDLIDDLAADIAANGVTLTGARGQPVANPAVSSVGKQRLILATLLKRLFPPDESLGQYRGRRAAEGRWRRP